MRKLLLLSLVIITFSSCTKYKDLVYFNKSTINDSIYHPQYSDFTINKGDLLYFTVHSINDEINKLFNDVQNTNINYAYSKANLFIRGYTVDNAGQINLPFIGKVMLDGLTVDSAENKIQKLISDYFNDVTVKVKFVGFNITILGEVNAPGFYDVYDRNFNLLEALGMARDINAYGDRKQIKIIHQNVEGISTAVIDLTTDEIFASENFFLQPNDVIYVPPVRNKNFRLNAPNISLVLSSITTLILVLNFITK